MNKYGPKARQEIAKSMYEFERGELRNGKAHTLLRNKKQALAIGIARARKKHYKVPR